LATSTRYWPGPRLVMAFVTVKVKIDAVGEADADQVERLRADILQLDELESRSPHSCRKPLGDNMISVMASGGVATTNVPMVEPRPNGSR